MPPVYSHNSFFGKALSNSHIAHDKTDICLPSHVESNFFGNDSANSGNIDKWSRGTGASIKWKIVL